MTAQAQRSRLGGAESLTLRHSLWGDQGAVAFEDEQIDAGLPDLSAGAAADLQEAAIPRCSGMRELP